MAYCKKCKNNNKLDFQIFDNNHYHFLCKKCQDKVELNYKTCIQCLEDKELTQENFYFLKSKDKYHTKCKICLKNNKYNETYTKIENKEFKKCKKCLKTKGIEEFYPIKGKRKCSNECKNCKIKKSKQIDIDKRNGFRICSKCNRKKSLVDFKIRKDRGSYQSWCRSCNNIRIKKWWKNNPEKLKER